MRVGAEWTDGGRFLRAQHVVRRAGTSFRLVLFCAAVEFGDFVAVSDEDDAGAIDEKTVFNDAGDIAEFSRQRRRIGDAAEVAIEDVMAFISDVRFAIGSLARLDFRSQSCDLLRD